MQRIDEIAQPVYQSLAFFPRIHSRDPFEEYPATPPLAPQSNMPIYLA